jgi:putative transposase
MAVSLYLAVAMNLFSRRIVGWSMRGDMRSEIVIDALEMAWFQRSPGKDAGLIFHSDRGSQYAGHEFNQVLNECGIKPSMSRKGKTPVRRRSVRSRSSGCLECA